MLSCSGGDKGACVLFQLVPQTCGMWGSVLSLEAKNVPTICKAERNVKVTKGLCVVIAFHMTPPQLQEPSYFLLTCIYPPRTRAKQGASFKLACQKQVSCKQP